MFRKSHCAAITLLETRQILRKLYVCGFDTYISPVKKCNYQLKKKHNLGNLTREPSFFQRLQALIIPEGPFLQERLVARSINLSFEDKDVRCHPVYTLIG